MARTSARCLTVAALLSLMLAACTDTTVLPDAARTPTAGASTPVAPSDGDTDAESGPDEPTAPQPAPVCRGMYSSGEPQPLVFAVHATRQPVEISGRLARRLLAGKIDSWRPLGGGPEPLRIVDATISESRNGAFVISPRMAVRTVERDRDTLAIMAAEDVGPTVQALTVDGVDPLRNPRGYPLETARPGCLPDVITMTIVGDIMLARGVSDAARAAGDPALQFRGLADRLDAAGILVGNLESTLSRAGEPTQGGDSFGAPRSAARVLASFGFDALSLANNHLGDYGDRALVQTVRRLREVGLRTFGAGANPRQAWRPVVVERGGTSFGFLGFNAIGETPGVAAGQPGAVSISMPPRTGPLDRAELRRFLGAVRRLDEQVDAVVVLPHWGTQYTNLPEPIQHTVARRLVRAGADLVVGGHPHWVQGVEMIGDTLVAHSLGNFIFDMDFMDETMKGVMLELTWWGDKLRGARFVPYRMDSTFTPRAESWAEAQDTLDLIWQTSGPAFRR